MSTSLATSLAWSGGGADKIEEELVGLLDIKAEAWQCHLEGLEGHVLGFAKCLAIGLARRQLASFQRRVAEPLKHPP